jgi:ketosteroid isomerase-like protein
MSGNDVEVIEEQFAATNARDFRRAMELYADDVVLTVPANAFLMSGTFEGKQAVGEYFGDWFATFEPGYRFEIEEIRQIGAVVFMVATHHGSGRSSGIEVARRSSYLYTVRDGKIAAVELFTDPDEALAAAEGR